MISLNYQTLNSFQEALRNKGLPLEEVNELALKVLALVVLHPHQVLNKKEDIFQAIESVEKNYPTVFIENSRNALSQYLEPPVLDLIAYLSESQEKGLLTAENKYQWIQKLLYQIETRPHFSSLIFDTSFYDLCNRLLLEVNHESVYIPFESMGYHSIMLGRAQEVMAEGVMQTALTALLTCILGSIHYKIGDAVRDPAYLQDGKLQIFSKGFLSGPWGMKDNLFEQETHRFAIKSNNYQNSLIHNLFSNVSYFALVVVTVNSLFSAVKSEENMRQWLVELGHLKAVVTLPSGIIQTSNINSALLIFDLRQKYSQVRFFDLKDSEFIEKQGRTVQLCRLDKLIDCINGKDEHDNMVVISHQTLSQNNYVLSPERYLINDELQSALDLLKKYPSKALSNVVSIIRPEAITKFKDEGKEPVFEIQGGDLPDFGYIDEASKQSLVSENNLSELQKGFLQADDILLTVRGTVGKVGLVSQQLIDAYQGRILAGQASLVLRIKNKAKTNPIALLMQLRSTFCQARLQQLTGGATIATLSSKDLKNFEIVELTLEEQSKLIADFEEQTQIKQQIQLLQNQQHQLTNAFWQNH